MNHPIEQELRRAVLAHPDADGPRLAYAGWCDGQPDPSTRARGDFIRTQVAMTDVFADPDSYPLRQRSETMQKTFGHAWAVPIAELVDRFVFDRGFVELVGLTASRFLDIAQTLFALAPIRHLDLADVKGVAAELFASPHLACIRSLRIDASRLDDADIERLAASPYVANLRWLSLAENQIGMDGAVALARSGNLDRLGYAWFFHNAVEPNQRYAYDNGFVVDDWMPADAIELERRVERVAPVRWLRHEAKTIADAIPDRFRMS